MLQHSPWGPRVQQTSAHTDLSPSVPSHSTWQGLKPSDPLTLLTIDYRPEILTDGLIQGTDTEFSSNSAVSGNSSDIQGVHQLLKPIKTRVNINRDPARTMWHHFFQRGGAPTPPTLCHLEWLPQWSATAPLCGYQPNEQRWPPCVHPLNK